MWFEFLEQNIRWDLSSFALINYTTLFLLARVSYLKNDIRDKKNGQGSIVLCPRLNVEILLQAEKDCIAYVHSVQNQQSPLVASIGQRAEKRTNRSRKAMRYSTHRNGRTCRSTLAINLRSVVVVSCGMSMGDSTSVSVLLWMLKSLPVVVRSPDKVRMD